MEFRKTKPAIVSKHNDGGYKLGVTYYPEKGCRGRRIEVVGYECSEDAQKEEPILRFSLEYGLYSRYWINPKRRQSNSLPSELLEAYANFQSESRVDSSSMSLQMPYKRHLLVLNATEKKAFKKAKQISDYPHQRHDWKLERLTSFKEDDISQIESSMIRNLTSQQSIYAKIAPIHLSPEEKLKKWQEISQLIETS